MKSVPPSTQTIGKLIPKGVACHGNNGGVHGHFGTASTGVQHALDSEKAEHSPQHGQALHHREGATDLPQTNL